jgi:hypothetical protein
MNLLLQENDSQGQCTIKHKLLHDKFSTGYNESTYSKKHVLSHFHVQLRCGLTLWGGDPASERTFKLQ